MCRAIKLRRKLNEIINKQKFHRKTADYIQLLTAPQHAARKLIIPVSHSARIVSLGCQEIPLKI